MPSLFRVAAQASLAATLLLAACAKEIITPGAPAAAPSSGETATASALAATPGGTVNGVMLQGFYWDVPQTTGGQTWWQLLGSQAPELAAAGFTAVWLPPAYKGGSVFDVGYGVYDRYDLGEFNQKGTVATHYGTLAQLQSCIAALHGRGIQVYEDVVMNHLTSADAQEQFSYNGQNFNVYTSFTYPSRANKYSSYQWHYYNFNGTQQAPNNGWYRWNAWDFQPYAGGQAYDNLLGSEIRYADPNQVAETIKWGNWLTTTLSLDGYRLDATKHMLTSFVNTWLDNVKGSSGRFAVSEAWFANLADLQNYAAVTGGRTSLFDVPLHYTFQAMSSGNGAWDMRGLQFAGFTEANGALAVPFVDNHDTDTPGGLFSPVINFKMLAYAYLLTREKGYPCVFYKDYYTYGLGPQLKTLLSIRRANAYGASYEYTGVDDADYYAYSRTGDAAHKGLMLILNDGGGARTKGISSPFKNATLTDKTGNYGGSITTDGNGYGNFPVQARSWSVWVPN